MPAKSPQLFDVILTDEDGKQTNIGRVEADSAFRLKVVSADAKQKEFLEETMELVNAKAVLHVEAPPPAGAPKFAVYSRELKRGADGFAAELQAYLKSYYDIVLKPVAEKKGK